MVQSIIDLGEDEDKILNIVKAQYGLKNKSQAVAFIAKKYEDSFLEPELKPEYLEKLNKIRKGKYLKFSSIEELEKATSQNA
jgi:hypothetical protein